jgi:predicted transcriptional regulator
LEGLVLSALREAAGPATAGWVQQRLGGGLAYTTVVTILTRLLAKGAVTRERTGRSFAWTPVSDQAGLAAHKMRKLLDGESDREAVLTRFVTSLEPGDERLLRSLLGQTDEPDTDGRGHPAAEGPRHPDTGGRGRTDADGHAHHATDRPDTGGRATGGRGHPDTGGRKPTDAGGRRHPVADGHAHPATGAPAADRRGPTNAEEHGQRGG